MLDARDLQQILKGMCDAPLQTKSIQTCLTNINPTMKLWKCHFILSQARTDEGEPLDVAEATFLWVYFGFIRIELITNGTYMGLEKNRIPLEPANGLLIIMGSMGAHPTFLSLSFL